MCAFFNWKKRVYTMIQMACFASYKKKKLPPPMTWCAKYNERHHFCSSGDIPKQLRDTIKWSRWPVGCGSFSSDILRHSPTLCAFRVDPIPYDTPKPAGHTRFVCVSDTHSRTDGIQMPYGDVLLHTGDFTELGLPSEVKKFNDWLGTKNTLIRDMHCFGCDWLLSRTFSFWAGRGWRW